MKQRAKTPMAAFSVLLFCFALAFLPSSTAGVGGGAVPEPATMLLLGFGLIGLTGFIRK